MIIIHLYFLYFAFTLLMCFYLSTIINALLAFKYFYTMVVVVLLPKVLLPLLNNKLVVKQYCVLLLPLFFPFPARTHMGTPVMCKNK